MAQFYHLFPFASVPPRCRVVLYGAGEVGQWYLSQLRQTGYAEVVAVADRSWNQYAGLDVPVVPLERLRELAYDCVVVSIEKRQVAQAVARELHEAFGVAEQKIVLGCDSLCELIMPIKPSVASHRPVLGIRRQENEQRPTHAHGLPLAFRCSYGLGDAVIMRKACEAVLSLAPAGSWVDFFCESRAIAEHVRVIFGQEAYCHGVYLMEQYAERLEQYALVFSGHRALAVEYMEPDCLAECAPRLLAVAKKIAAFDALYHREWNAVVLRNYALSHILGWNCYTCLGGGALPIQNRKVSLSLWPEAEPAFQRLKLGRYITVGTRGTGPDGRHPVKEWPDAQLSGYLRLVHQAFPELSIVQLGSAGSRALPEADCNLLGEDLRVVEQVLAHSLLHVDCESGLVHVATQLGTRCAVIFGPTDPAHFAYLENINIRADVCAPCCGAWEDESHCLRDEEIPPCMVAVTPEMVFEQTRGWLQEQWNQEREK